MRQLSVVGRSGNMKDVLIDSTGAFTGVLILLIIIVTFKGIRGFFNFLFRRNKNHEYKENI